MPSHQKHHLQPSHQSVIANGPISWFLAILSASMAPLLLLTITPASVTSKVATLLCSNVAQWDYLPGALTVRYLHYLVFIMIFDISIPEISLSKNSLVSYPFRPFPTNHKDNSKDNFCPWCTKPISIMVLEKTTVRELKQTLATGGFLPNGEASQFVYFTFGLSSCLRECAAIAELGVHSLSHLTAHVNLLGGGLGLWVFAVNPDGTLKDALEIMFYNSAGDDSDTPIAGPSNILKMTQMRTWILRMKSLLTHFLQKPFLNAAAKGRLNGNNCTHQSVTKAQKPSVTVEEIDDEEAPQVTRASASSLKKPRTTNPIHFFYEEVKLNAAGHMWKSRR
ncbi:hypothetical protein BT96DRAFT_948641 [Gymnopus androsaceus JB14]|uniref:Uncharacterized protein n=1 Tax=Gymnopus androsaceus JB14 TaxID=1447944 RepID=A0A6A4GNC7_9AGAR|nr:hypothetical protein BT96DRAFT_948641 [Gymnopus androsaceus JB14]